MRVEAPGPARPEYFDAAGPARLATPQRQRPARRQQSAHRPRLLDRMPADQELAYLRQLLIAGGVLPQRFEPLASLGPWLDGNSPVARAATPC